MIQTATLHLNWLLYHVRCFKNTIMNLEQHPQRKQSQLKSWVRVGVGIQTMKPS